MGLSGNVLEGMGGMEFVLFLVGSANFFVPTADASILGWDTRLRAKELPILGFYTQSSYVHASRSLPQPLEEIHMFIRKACNW